jgi:hypothetical protein
MKQLKIGDLNELYSKGETADKPIFAEMRTNVLLEEGSHHKKIAEKIMDRLRDSRVSETLKLKLSKNHIQVVTKDYRNGITSGAPGVKVIPFNENEQQDIKDAELSQAVWEDAEEKQNIDAKIDRWAQDFVVLGECACKIYWDPNKGKLKGYQQKTTPSGDPLFQHPELGEVTDSSIVVPGAQGLPQQQQLKPVASDIPVFEGELVIEPIFAFNLIRDPAAESMEAARWLCVRKMVSIEDAKAFLANLPDDEDRQDKIDRLKTSSEQTFKVFDATKAEYSDMKDHLMLREYYFRPCSEYPNGYYYISSDVDIFFEGELPFGLFPILTEGFDSIPTSPRSRSIIKAIKSCQIEINRMASQRAMHQITFGDDKLITFNSSRLQKGAQWAGLREFVVPGDKAPVHLPGRAGDQFAQSIQEEVAELYRLANLDMMLQEKPAQDVQAMLYTSLQQRKVYSLYVRKFERFICNVAKLYLLLAQQYLPDDYVIQAIGRREQVNLPEFRRIQSAGFNIKLKPMTQDIESIMGRQISATTALQYGGDDIPKHVKGLLMKNLPFLNTEQALDFMVIDIRNIESDILALDRGEYPQSRATDPHDLYIQFLNKRMKEGDFRFLPPQIQQSYERKLQEHTQLAAQEIQKLKAMESEFIPSSGALVTCSVQVPDPDKPGAH